MVVLELVHEARGLVLCLLLADTYRTEIHRLHTELVRLQQRHPRARARHGVGLAAGRRPSLILAT